MMINNIQGNRAYPVATFKTKRNNQQTSFKGNAVAETQHQGMTKEQKTWLAVGLTTLGAIAIGLIAWACSKNKKTSKTSQTVDKATVKIKEQFKELDDKMQKHFINVSLKEYNPRWDMVKVVPNVQASFESKNDFSLYEQMVLVPQLLGRRKQLYENKLLTYRDNAKANEYAYKNANIKETFVEYLKLRSEYFDKDNEFDVVRSEVLKDPSDDVVDAETLRLHMLANNTRQFLYSDESVEEEHQMVFFVEPLITANYIAKMLEDFKPKKAQKDMTENEKKYFEYMNKLGAFWHERLKKEASEKLPNFTKIITGEVEAPKCYTKGKAERHDKRFIPSPNWKLGTRLTEMLSRETETKRLELIERSETIENKTTSSFNLDIHANSLAAAYDTLKQAVDDRDYDTKNDLKSKISNLIDEVLI